MSLVVDQYAIPGLLSAVGMHQIIRFAMQVGYARGKHKVSAPATDGPEAFVRVYRAHQNALESYTMSLSGLWLGAVFTHPIPASILYGGYLIGRERCFWGYCESAEKRLPGLYFSYRCIKGLGVLILFGAVNSLSRSYLDFDIARALQDRLTFLKM